MTVVELRLGPRPDEPGPPISQGPQSYSGEVTQRLAGDAAQIIARYPDWDNREWVAASARNFLAA